MMDLRPEHRFVFGGQCPPYGCGGVVRWCVWALALMRFALDFRVRGNDGVKGGGT